MHIKELPSATYLNGSRIAHGQRGTRAGLTARLAIKDEAMAEAQALRHAGYLSYGHIDVMENGLFSDHFDGLPTSKTIVVYKDGQAAASVRVSLFAPYSNIQNANDIPAAEIFRDEVLALIEGLGRNGRPPHAAEISRLVRHPHFADDHELVFALYRMSCFLYLYFDADLLLAAVRENHKAIYRRMGFQLIAEPRAYPRTNFKTGLMACLREKYEKFMATAPFLANISSEDRIFADFMGGAMVPVFPLSSNDADPVMPDQTGVAISSSYPDTFHNHRQQMASTGNIAA